MWSVLKVTKSRQEKLETNVWKTKFYQTAFLRSVDPFWEVSNEDIAYDQEDVECLFKRVVCLTPVVQRVNNVIPRINHYPVDDIQALLGVLGYGIFS